jgi:phytol kinase
MAKNIVMQQSRELIRPVTGNQSEFTVAIARFQVEVIRKSLHLLIALVPVIAAINLPATLSLLAAGTLFYAFAEASRRQGNPIFVVSDLTIIASREMDRKGFVLGPVTLGLGAMLSLLLYPLPSASIAIFALAFGDGFASLVGTLVRGPRIPLLRTKTIAGSLACFTAVFLVTLSITMKPVDALVVAAAATVLEAIPVGNFDNIIIPFGVGMVATQLLAH